MLQGSSTLSEFHTSLSKVLTLWYCVKVKQHYLSISSTTSKLFNTNFVETQNILEIEQVIWPQCAWWPYDSKSCEARQETQREVGLENAVHALVDCLASWATKNWNIAHSRPENFIFIGLTPTTHSIKYVCILGTDLHYSNYLAH